MPMDVAPQRRHAVEVTPAINVNQPVAVTALDDQRLVIGQPRAHLSERMPQMAMVRIAQPLVALVIHRRVLLASRRSRRDYLPSLTSLKTRIASTANGMPAYCER